MKIRLLQFANNFHKDKYTQEIDTSKALGSYCAFGFYDALNVDSVYQIGDSKRDIWYALQEAAYTQLDGKCNWRNFVCGIEDDASDTDFWETASKKLFLFITMVRINIEEPSNSENLQLLIDDINSIQQSNEARCKIAYFCHDHSQVIILHCYDEYETGFKNILSIRDFLETMTMHTVLAVQETFLKNHLH